MSFNLADFQNPPAAFRPVPFWSLNEKLEAEELVRQVRLMKQAGWGGAFLHSRVGLITPYLQQDWMAACKAVIDECRRQGLQVWLYDEDGWPSGFSGGSVPLADESFRMKVLFARPTGALPPEGSIPVGEPREGLQVYRWTSPLGSPRFNGTCYADMLNPQAMRQFLNDAYQRYYDEFADEYAQTIVAEFLDEPCAVVPHGIPAGAVPYTDALFEVFERLHGYDPQPCLHWLFMDEARAARFRVHYSRVVSDLFEESFTKQLGEWCSEHRIALTGHFMEGSLHLQQSMGNRIMPNYRHQHIPGIDHLGLQNHEILTAKQCQSVVNQFGKSRMLCEMFGVAGQAMSFEDRQWIALHSILLGVNLINPHLSLYTMAGERKRDWPPNLFYQQSWFEKNAALDEPLSRLCVAMAQGQYLADVLVLHPFESVAALWRVRTDWPDSSSLNPGPLTCEEITVQVNQLDADLHTVMHALLDSHRSFDLGDEGILAESATVTQRDGIPRFRVEQMEYQAVVIPSMVTIAPATLKLLRDFAKIGGLVLRCGTAPTLLDGEPSAELGEFMATLPHVAPDSLSEAVREQVPPLVSVVSSGDASLVRSHVRRLPNGDLLVLLVNFSRVGERVHVSLELSGAWRSAYRLNTTNGQQKLLQTSANDAGIGLEMSLAPVQYHLLRVSLQPDDKAAVSTLVTRPSSAYHLEIPDEAWVVERLDDNALVLDLAAWKESSFADFSTRSIPVLSIRQRLNDFNYRGPLSLRYSFEVSGLAAGRKVHLVVERPEAFKITVNSTPVAYEGLPFYLDFRWLPINISHLVHEGQNHVVLEFESYAPADPTSIHDQAARYGTEIEALYLIGDFYVRATELEEIPAIISHAQSPWGDGGKTVIPPVRAYYFAGASLALCEPAPLCFGDVTRQGLPFYPGRLEMSLQLPAAAMEQSLALSNLDAAVAHLEADGQEVGCLIASPWELELPDGTQRISLTLYGSLRNLLGPHHLGAGDPITCTPWSFYPHCGELAERAANILAWGEGCYEPSKHRESYACRSLGQINSVWLKSCL